VNGLAAAAPVAHGEEVILIPAVRERAPASPRRRRADMVLPLETELERLSRQPSPRSLEAFWAKVEAHGTPWIEPLPDRPGLCRVTFLYRGDARTRNVVLVSGATLDRIEESRFRRRGTSDIWSFSLEWPDDTRTGYWLAANDSLVPLSRETDLPRRFSSFLPDPRNHRTFEARDPGDPDDPGLRVSMAELPRAPRDPLTRRVRGVPRGAVTAHRLPSRILRGDRRVWTYDPPPPAGRRARAVVIAFDGFVHLGPIPLPVILDNLHAEGRIAPTRAIIVDTLAEGDRSRLLTCNDAFRRFLADELLPRFGLDPAAEDGRTVLAGQSLGAVAALHALFGHPELFRGALLQSGDFPWAPEGEEPNALARLASRARGPPASVWMEVGSMEGGTVGEGGVSTLAANRHLRDVLVARGDRVAYREFHGGHDYPCWRESFSIGLRWLLPSAGDSEGDRSPAALSRSHPRRPGAASAVGPAKRTGGHPSDRGS